jgi:hypothetical protein
MRALPILLVAALVTGGLAACSGPGSSDISASASMRLQRDVRDVARLAADHKYPAALRQLRSLRTAVQEAVAAGEIGAERAARIGASLNLVQQDLDAKIPTPTPQPHATTASPRATATPSSPTKAQQEKTAEAKKKAEEDAKKQAEEAKKKADEEAKKEKGGDEKKQEEEGDG